VRETPIFFALPRHGARSRWMGRSVRAWRARAIGRSGSNTFFQSIGAGGNSLLGSFVSRSLPGTLMALRLWWPNSGVLAVNPLNRR